MECLHFWPNGRTGIVHLVEGSGGTAFTLCGKIRVTQQRRLRIDVQGIRIYQVKDKDCRMCWQAAKKLARNEKRRQRLIEIEKSSADRPPEGGGGHECQ
jgi:hypothetical protein